MPRELWEAAGELGMLCTATTADYGGSGASVLHCAVVWEEQMYANTSGPGFALHSDIVAPYLEHYGSEEQKQQYLPAMATGKCITAIAMTEPGAGSDLQGVRTSAKRDGDDWILNGSKTYITNGYWSDMVIVVASTSPGKGAAGLSLFLVDASMPGFTKGKKLDKLGLRAQDTSELFFEDVRLPQSALLGEEGKGFRYLMKELPQERLLIAAMAQASSEFMFETTRNYCRDRQAFGGSLLKLQTVAHSLAQVKSDAITGRALVDQCLSLHNRGALDAALASVCKLQATEIQGRIADQCLQLHGGAGFIRDYDVRHTTMTCPILLSEAHVS